MPTQTPAHWSPDGRRLAFGFAGSRGDVAFGVVLDVDRGTATEVRTHGQLLGWASGSTLVWLAADSQDGPRLVVESDVGSSRVLDRVALQPRGPQPALNQYGLLTGDGRYVALTTDAAFDASPGTRWFDRRTGAETGQAVPLDAPLAWYPRALPATSDVVRTRERPGGGLVTERVAPDGTVTELSTTAPSLRLHTVGWAGEALLGEPDRDLLGRLPLPRELAVALLAAGLSYGLWWRRRRS